uniref:MAM domain-containing protein n=1 Tax=Erpetoichthys calabaricus TaxID=27687 RepID=A0A8C4TB03_ERPCA
MCCYGDSSELSPLFSCAGGCTFDEDSDPSLCEYSQGEEDDFDWQLVRIYETPPSTSDLLHGKVY